jgi:hypothetical protein
MSDREHDLVEHGTGFGIGPFADQAADDPQRGPRDAYARSGASERRLLVP